MNQNFFVAIASIGILGASLAACSVTTTDGTSGSGGTSSASGTTTSTSGGGEGGSGTTTTSTGGGGGAGGGSACLSCAEYSNSDTATIEDTCGYSDTGCEAGSSCELLVALGDCVCGTAEAPGACVEDCPASCEVDPNGDETDCQTCAIAECEVQAGACLNDA